MINTKISASKNAGKTEKKQQQQQQSIQSPLQMKDINISSSCSSSFSSCSISSEGPTGCLRFFLSHHSSTVSKNGTNKKPKSIMGTNTPKSAPNIKRPKGNLNGNGGNLVKKRNNLENPEKPTSRNVHRLKKKPPPPCLYPWKSGKKPSSRSDLSDSFRKNSVGYDVKLSENAGNFTPVNKIGCGSVNLGDTSSPIPPIQASVSPEIQGGSTSVVKATPNTCYAAGHVLSGVSDKRKCRPKGLLTIGDNDLFGSSKTKVFFSEDENFIGCFNKPRISLVPCPTEASMQWNLSPCDEIRSTYKDDDHGKSGAKLNECKMSPSKLISCSSSPSSSLGFSSEFGNRSNSTITASDATTDSNSSRSRSSGFRGLLGPSFDHLVCSPSTTSPLFVPSSKVEVSPKQDKYQHDHETETTPCSVNSIGSGNVIQTPQSNSSSPNHVLSHLSRDEISRLWFESELDSVTEVLRRVSLSPECEIPMVDESPRMSFEFNPLIRPDSSIDFAMFRKVMDSQSSPGALESEVRISWREGLASRIFEMDELECCRCFSDEEDDANGSSDPSASYSCPEVADINCNKFAADASETTKLLHSESRINPKGAEKSLSEGNSPRLKLSNDNGSSDVAEEFNWKVCYENHLFQV
ncbi:hypothetical protein BVRB_3g059340 [Beta vulgaris subsp. vulgaris]|nr:hypothetical protein BVRB_3g059340 [Beta vulgaris subsp. vulgaris]